MFKVVLNIANLKSVRREGSKGIRPLDKRLNMTDIEGNN